jgi:parallel beta-helix repeat protein
MKTAFLKTKITHLLTNCFVLGIYLVIASPALAANSPCAHVENNQTIIKSFCSDADPNPIQNAINFAHQNNYNLVQLDGGNFVLTQPIRNSATTMYSPFNAGIGLYVPSNIILTGSTNLNDPTIVSIGANIDSVDVIIYVADDQTNLDATLHDTTLSYLEINGTTNNIRKSVVGIWVGKADRNINLHHLHIHDSGTALIVGRYGQYERDPATGNGKSYPFAGEATRYLQIHDNEIHNMSGDGIAVMAGGYVEISNNIVYEALTPGVSNAITGFVGVNHLWIHNNTLSNVNAGIGLDGSFPLYLSGIPAEDIPTVQDRVGIGNETGFGYGHLILHNTISQTTNGILLWRQHHTIIVDNNVNNSTNGILLNEARDNYIGGNILQNLTSGVVVSATGNSLYGSNYNGIGFYTDNQGNLHGLGNNFINNTTGVYLRGNPSDTVKQNTVKNNCFINIQTPINADESVGSLTGDNTNNNCNAITTIPDLNPKIPPTTPNPTPKPGDLNGDGKVDSTDFTKMVANFGHPYTIYDYNVLVGNFGK